jgi:hypothetical protein
MARWVADCAVNRRRWRWGFPVPFPEKHAYEVFVESVWAHHFTNPFYHLRAESRALAQFGKAVRADIDASAAGGDPGTADVFTEISRAADKQPWLVEAHLDSALLFDILQTS